MEVLKLILSFLSFLLVQVLVLNHIHLFNYATPLPYIYILFLVPHNHPKWKLLLWAFSMGICVDMFSNTPGVATTSLTFVAILYPFLLEWFIVRENTEDLTPSMKELGVGRYILFVFILVLIYCLLFFTLETFSFFNWQQWLYNIGGSTVLTMFFILVLDNLRNR